CRKCYGWDFSTRKEIELGVPVGIVAAQSIGEPGTQLTLRTFHTGGTASSGGDITQGLPRVEELFEARQKPKGEAVISEIGGSIEIRIIDGVRHVFVTDRKLIDDAYEVPEGWTVKVTDGYQAEVGEVLAEGDEEVITARHSGRVVLNNGLKVVWENREEHDYEIPAGMRLVVSEGDEIRAGDRLTEGSKNPHRILEIQGRDAVTAYLLREVQNVYQPQGQNINDKHFEVIIRKMLSRVVVTTPGDTDMLPGELVEATDFQEKNEEVTEEGGQPATARPVLLGISKASLETDSFLSASSFQHTIRVLAGAAIAGKEDDLVGLKENVIIGKLIPAGTGFKVASDEEEIEEDVDLVDIDPTKMLIDDNTDPAILDALTEAAAEAKRAELERRSSEADSYADLDE
ncbi:MAG: hypothetical protein KDE51_17120, partial [Anaerolineales bacterium]|nr:hypothetical protein [Anaerolineales bacterium]